MDLNYTGTKLLRIANFHDFLFMDAGSFHHYTVICTICITVVRKCMAL